MRLTFPSLALTLLAPLAMGAEPKDPKALAVSAEKTAAAKAFIAQWADADAGVRLKATAGLTKMGRDALPALLEARRGKPSDVLRERLDELIPDARKDDLDARAEVFLADKERKFDHDLLGWNELKAAVKDTKESRLLFADILNDEDCRAMLLLAFDPADAAREQFEQRWENKHKEWRARSRAELKAGLKTVGSVPKADDPIHWMPAALLADLLYDRDYRSDYRQAIVRCYVDHADEAKLAVEGKGKYGEAVRGLASYWIGQQHQRFGLQDARTIGDHMKFDKEALRATQEKLFELIVSTGQSNVSIRQLAGTRDPKYIANFRRLFEIDKPFWTKRDDNPLPDIQLRDAGLSMCIALSGQDPVEYGFTADRKSKATDNARFDPYNFYFGDADGKTADDKRKTAFKKWAEWEKANPDKIKAKSPDKK